MGKFTKVSADIFNELQIDAGVLLKTFNPDAPGIAQGAIICATTGGINPSCVPTYSDMFEDVDNAPNNTKEGKHLDGWDCKITTTGLGVTPEAVKLALGAADIDGTNSSKIVPRRDLKQTDFRDLWWAGDKANGGWAAVRLINALSTGGFSLKTSKNGKGNVDLEITGHASASAQDIVPMEFYVSDDAGEDLVSVSQTLMHVTSSFTEAVADTGEAFSAVLTADDGYTIQSVIVMVAGVDVTSSRYTSGTKTVSIPAASIDGPIEIIATANPTT